MQSSSSAAKYKSSEFCLEIPAGSMKNNSAGTQMQVFLFSDTPKANIYFQTVQADFSDDPSGFGFQLLNANDVTGSDVTGLPIYYYAMDAATINMFMAKITGTPAPILINVYLWADPALASLKFEFSGLTQSAPIKYGWAHNSPIDTLNSNGVITWENK